MSVLESTEAFASQLLNNCYDDVDINENDPDQMPYMDTDNNSAPKDNNIKSFN